MFRSILSSATSEPFSPALEAAYQTDLAGEKIRMLYIACVLCVLLYMSSAFLDAGALPGHVAGAWIIRSTVVLATAVVVVAIRLRPEAFLRRLDELLAARQGAATVAVLFLDLDGFKPVNDSHGHAAGDHVLAVIAERLRGTIRASDLAARLGGDEFVVAVPLADANGELVLRRLRAALRAAIAEPVEFKGHHLRVSASIGSALCPRDAGSAAQLVDLADQTMYESKRQRKRLVS